MKKFPPTQRRTFLRLTGCTLLATTEFIPEKGFATTTQEKPFQQPENASHQSFIDRAFELRRLAIDNGDQGYGALVVCNGIIIGQSPSEVIVNRDPTAHAEMQAIRDAASRLDNPDLTNCILYSSSRACPMCEAAAYWSGISQMIYGEQITDAGRPSLCR